MELHIIGAAAVMFAATNIDDAVVLTVFNAASRGRGTPKQWQIWVGQYVGVAVMVVVSVLGALGLHFVSLHWVGLLGLIPLSRGISGLIAAVRGGGGAGEPAGGRPVAGLLGVIAVTVANGGDNVTVYTAAFRVQTPAEIAVTIGVFAIGVALWCLAGMLLVSHQRLADGLQRHSRWLVPVVFIVLGVYVIVRSGLFGVVVDWVTRAGGG